MKMLRHAPTSVLGKLHCSVNDKPGRQQWAVRDIDANGKRLQCCGRKNLSERAESRPSLQSRANHAETLEADIQATLKFGFTLHFGGPV